MIHYNNLNHNYVFLKLNILYEERAKLLQALILLFQFQHLLQLQHLKKNYIFYTLCNMRWSHILNTNNNAPAISSLQIKLVCCEPYRFLERVYRRHLHRYSSVWWWHWCHQEMARPPVHPACQHRLTSGRSTGQVWDQWQGQWQILPVVKCFILSIDSATYSCLLAN